VIRFAQRMRLPRPEFTDVQKALKFIKAYMDVVHGARMHVDDLRSTIDEPFVMFVDQNQDVWSLIGRQEVLDEANMFLQSFLNMRSATPIMLAVRLGLLPDVLGVRDMDLLELARRRLLEWIA